MLTPPTFTSGSVSSHNTGNPDTARDDALFARLGLKPMPFAGADLDPCSDTVHADILASAAA